MGVILGSARAMTWQGLLRASLWLHVFLMQVTMVARGRPHGNGKRLIAQVTFSWVLIPANRKMTVIRLELKWLSTMLLWVYSTQATAHAGRNPNGLSYVKGSALWLNTYGNFIINKGLCKWLFECTLWLLVKKLGLPCFWFMHHKNRV